MEQTSGHVTVWGPLDRERESRYVFHVQASVNFSSSLNTNNYYLTGFQAAKRGTSLISSATVVVQILDVNERPIFLNNHYIAWVSEHANIGEPIHAFISAVDYDEASHDMCVCVRVCVCVCVYTTM